MKQQRIEILVRGCRRAECTVGSSGSVGAVAFVQRSSVQRSFFKLNQDPRPLKAHVTQSGHEEGVVQNMKPQVLNRAAASSKQHNALLRESLLGGLVARLFDPAASQGSTCARAAMPDYVSDPRASKLPFTKLKKFLTTVDGIDEDVSAIDRARWLEFGECRGGATSVPCVCLCSALGQLHKSSHDPLLPNPSALAGGVVGRDQVCPSPPGGGEERRPRAAAL